MMTLKPNCECCDRDLPPDAVEARVCTFECTFCVDCARSRFDDVCPNCGGELVRRPRRTPASLARFPASSERFTKAHAACGDVADSGAPPVPANA